MSQPDYILEVHGLKKHFSQKVGLLRRRGALVKAVDGLDLSVPAGRTFSLVGESGCGKTTAGRTILRLLEPTDGRVIFRSRKLAPAGRDYLEIDVAQANRKRIRDLRREMQIIYQDPYSSLNPRMTVGEIISEPLVINSVGGRKSRRARTAEMLEAVGLQPAHSGRYPHEFSGGQRQRIGIARALALQPSLIVADEPVSALDVSIQAQVINLLAKLQREFGLTYLFIAHDLALVRHISDWVAVMYLGRIVECAPADQLFERPAHPYTEALISAVPVPDPDHQVSRIRLTGETPSPVAPPPGCTFHNRCRYTQDVCRRERPTKQYVGEQHYATCHFAGSLDLKALAGS